MHAVRPGIPVFLQNSGRLRELKILCQPITDVIDTDLAVVDVAVLGTAFLDVIQARRDSGYHRIEAGLQDSAVLFDELDALALTFEAMAEAYDWVICRLYAAPRAVDLLELVAGFMDSVVIASNADAEDPALADLYALAEEAGSLAAYFWRYEPTEVLATPQAVSVSPESIALSKDLKKRGWKFVGPTTVYAFMQAMGLVNDHAEGCVTRAEVARARAAFQRPG